MKMKIKSLLLTVALLCVSSLLACSRFSHTKDNPQPFLRMAAHIQQTDFTIADRYPLSSSDVDGMILRANNSEMREHGWTILAHMTSANGAPRTDGNSSYEALWDSETTPWDTKCTLGLGGNNKTCLPRTPRSNTDCRLLPVSRRPKNGPDIETPLQQVDFNQERSLRLPKTNRTVLGPPIAFISSVRYNAKAAETIRDHCLYDRKLAIGDKQEGLNNFSPDANQFDPASVIVKLIWAIPDKDGHIFVWDPSYGINRTLPNSPSDWPSVKVTTDTNIPCSSNGFSTHPQSDTASPEVQVPVNCFYHRQYACELLNNNIRPSNFGGIYHCPAGQKFQALLMGVHIITAEHHDWVWNTYWWTPDPSKDPGHEGQTDAVSKRGPWRFYAMQVAMSPSMPLDPTDGLPHIAFNPYIEGPGTPNATVSNCMYCHKRAVVYPATSTQSADVDLAKGSPKRCAFMSPVPAGCGSLAADYNAPYTTNQTPTHFLWSLADNVDYLRQGREQLIPPGILSQPQ
jgi:hypothetical protein